MIQLPQLCARRYLQPLREGGSLPAVVETEDGLYVAKFRGAGHGPLALIAELVVGLLAKELRMRIPEMALIDVPPGFGSDQPDPEIRELLEASQGTNIGLRYLDGAFNFDPNAAGDLVSPREAAKIVWLDAFVSNPDRTVRNPNLMVWNRRLWLIDHGSALYAHHAWSRVDQVRTRGAFPLIRDHILLCDAEDLETTDARLSGTLTPHRLSEILAAVPQVLLMDPLTRGGFSSAGGARARYVRYLAERLETPRAWVEEAVRAQRARRVAPKRRLDVRR